MKEGSIFYTMFKKLFSMQDETVSYFTNLARYFVGTMLVEKVIPFLHRSGNVNHQSAAQRDKFYKYALDFSRSSKFDTDLIIGILQELVQMLLIKIIEDDTNFQKHNKNIF